MFVNPPTGYGKSLIYQALPFVYDSILEAAGHIPEHIGVVVSPLVNLMKDQVDKLANLGILAASLSEITEKEKGVVEQKISIVYASPEARNSELKNVDGPTQLLQFTNKFVIKPSYLSSA